MTSVVDFTLQNHRVIFSITELERRRTTISLADNTNTLLLQLPVALPTVLFLA